MNFLCKLKFHDWATSRLANEDEPFHLVYTCSRCGARKYTGLDMMGGYEEYIIKPENVKALDEHLQKKKEAREAKKEKKETGGKKEEKKSVPMENPNFLEIT